MGISYVTAPQDLHEAVMETMGRFHSELAEAEVTIGVLYAYNDSGEPAVKHHGYACEATIKINSLQDRVEGKPDATLKIDGKLWKEELSEDEKLALIDHELQHLELQRDEEGHVKADDHGRPKLKIRLHDWQIGGFEVTAARHKAASTEVRQAKVLRDTWGQLLWDFDGADVIDRSDTTLTVSSPGVESVTLTGKDFDRISKTIDKAASRKPSPARKPTQPRA